jgi:hypothetical protein
MTIMAEAEGVVKVHDEEDRFLCSLCGLHAALWTYAIGWVADGLIDYSR